MQINESYSACSLHIIIGMMELLILTVLYSPSLHEVFFSSLNSNNGEGVRSVLNQVEWTEEASTMIETIINSNLYTYCLDSKVSPSNYMYIVTH